VNLIEAQKKIMWNLKHPVNDSNGVEQMGHNKPEQQTNMWSGQYLKRKNKPDQTGSRGNQSDFVSLTSKWCKPTVAAEIIATRCDTVTPEFCGTVNKWGVGGPWHNNFVYGGAWYNDHTSNLYWFSKLSLPSTEKKTFWINDVLKLM